MTQWLHVNGEWFLPLIVGVSTFFLFTVALWPRKIKVRITNVPDQPTLAEQIGKASKHMHIDG